MIDNELHYYKDLDEGDVLWSRELNINLVIINIMDGMMRHLTLVSEADIGKAMDEREVLHLLFKREDELGEKHFVLVEKRRYVPVYGWYPAASLNDMVKALEFVNKDQPK